ncbi:MAG: DUF3417 domain-containing protein [Deinococcales bacterium]
MERSGHNAVAMLRDVAQNKLEEAAKHPAYLNLYDKVIEEFDHYLADESRWFQQNILKNGKELKDHLYAYFCAEYGWHESLTLYSGGLGILAGDHTKAASDLGVPLRRLGCWFNWRHIFISRLRLMGNKVLTIAVSALLTCPLCRYEIRVVKLLSSKYPCVSVSLNYGLGSLKLAQSKV